MTIARLYIMHAAEGKAAALSSALDALAEHVRALSGCLGVESLRDLANDRRFVFIEKWDSEDAHKAASGSLDKAIIAPMMEALDGRPDGSYFEYSKVL